MSIDELTSRVVATEKSIRKLDKTITRLASQGMGAKIVPIITFAPEPFELIKDIKVIIEEVDGEFNASFFDANVNASGCNEQEAFDNLKDLLLSRFDYLDKQKPGKLSKPLEKQIAVLREFIRRRM